MQVMIVGAGGYIGTRLAAELRQHGHEVLAVSSRARGGIDPQTGWLSADFEVPGTVGAVYYLATAPAHRNAVDSAAQMLNVNVASAVAAAVAARRAGARKFVYTSTGNVYAPAFTPLRETAPVCRSDWYSLAKIQAEEALALFRGDMEVTVARLFGIYGPRQERRLVPNLINAVRSGEPVTIERNSTDRSDLDGLRISLCYIKDTVRLLCALAMPGRPPILNLAGDEVLSVRQIATAIGAAVGREPVFEISSASRRSDLVADITLLKQELQPQFTPFESGLRATLASLPS